MGFLRNLGNLKRATAREIRRVLGILVLRKERKKEMREDGKDCDVRESTKGTDQGNVGSK